MLLIPHQCVYFFIAVFARGTMGPATHGQIRGGLITQLVRIVLPASALLEPPAGCSPSGQDHLVTSIPSGAIQGGIGKWIRFGLTSVEQLRSLRVGGPGLYHSYRGASDTCPGGRCQGRSTPGKLPLLWREPGSCPGCWPIANGLNFYKPSVLDFYTRKNKSR